jgi:folate-binding protein YgfZ
MIPEVSSPAYQAARHHAALVDRSNRGRIVVSGADRASYLQGLLTNDVAALKAGTGCYATYLTPQGRMIADLTVYELGDVMLLTLNRDVKDIVLAKLDQFIFTEDVRLGDVTDTFAQIAIVGPAAADELSRVLSGVSAVSLAALAEHGNLRVDWAGSSAVVARTNDAGEPGYDVFVDRERRDAFVSAIASAEVVELDEATAEAIRIEGGVPVFHRDMDEETIPLEAGIESRAISFTKGCYVGQEVIVRVLHRGHGRVARRLIGLRVDGPSAPPSGTLVRAGDREVGHVTSSAWSPTLEQPIALAYIHRDFVEPGTIVTVGGVNATVTQLPFVPRQT